MGVNSRQPVRSVSLPCRSHPRTDKMDKLLNMFKSTWELTSNPSAEIIFSGFSHLTALYECLEDLLNTNLSQISTNDHNMKWTDELLDISVKFLYICSNTADVLSRIKQHVSELGCDLRRHGVCSIESITARYIAFRNKLKKDIKESMANLKQVESIICSCPFMVFKEVAECNAVIFRLFLEFLGVPLLKTNRKCRWKAVSRFLSSGKVLPEEKAYTHVNELQSLDDALLRCSTSEKHEFIQLLPNKLEALEATLEGMDSHLQLLSRRLIATRVSLLNMVSFYYSKPS
ncbi:uncharacterized protein LOC143589702 [Bidens hawaiensis]|uniref:uncharacterized protein LOC143589702 n=1 Tax=Bidens hawaiensis TaxID=980011 RepID=UPI00404A4811